MQELENAQEESRVGIAKIFLKNVQRNRIFF